MAKYEIEGQARLIRELRLNAKTTQGYVAEKIGLKMHTYEKYEVGKTMPNQVTLLKLSKMYDVPIQAFFEPLLYLDALYNGYAYGTNDLTPFERQLIQKLRSFGD